MAEISHSVGFLLCRVQKSGYIMKLNKKKRVKTLSFYENGVISAYTTQTR